MYSNLFTTRSLIDGTFGGDSFNIFFLFTIFIILRKTEMIYMSLRTIFSLWYSDIRLNLLLLVFEADVSFKISLQRMNGQFNFRVCSSSQCLRPLGAPLTLTVPWRSSWVSRKLAKPRYVARSLTNRTKVFWSRSAILRFTRSLLICYLSLFEYFM